MYGSISNGPCVTALRNWLTDRWSLGASVAAIWSTVRPSGNPARSDLTNGPCFSASRTAEIGMFVVMFVYSPASNPVLSWRNLARSLKASAERMTPLSLSSAATWSPVSPDRMMSSIFRCGPEAPVAHDCARADYGHV